MRSGNSITRYLQFIVQLIGWMGVLALITPILVGVFQGSIKGLFGTEVKLSDSDFILLITAAFVIAYTYETKKIREESIFQRKMGSANDVKFKMLSKYLVENPDGSLFGELSSPERLHNVSDFCFITTFSMKPIGMSAPFQKITADKKFFVANYFIKTNEGRKVFLNTLKKQDGEIQAKVLMTNGDRFIYTYKAGADNWKKVLEEDAKLFDYFTLIKKEVDEA